MTSSLGNLWLKQCVNLIQSGFKTPANPSPTPSHETDQCSLQQKDWVEGLHTGLPETHSLYPVLLLIWIGIPNGKMRALKQTLNNSGLPWTGFSGCLLWQHNESIVHVIRWFGLWLELHTEGPMQRMWMKYTYCRRLHSHNTVACMHLHIWCYGNGPSTQTHTKHPFLKQNLECTEIGVHYSSLQTGSVTSWLNLLNHPQNIIRVLKYHFVNTLHWFNVHCASDNAEVLKDKDDPLWIIFRGLKKKTQKEKIRKKNVFLLYFKKPAA